MTEDDSSVQQVNVKFTFTNTRSDNWILGRTLFALLQRHNALHYQRVGCESDWELQRLLPLKRISPNDISVHLHNGILGLIVSKLLYVHKVLWKKIFKKMVSRPRKFIIFVWSTFLGCRNHYNFFHCTYNSSLHVNKEYTNRDVNRAYSEHFKNDLCLLLELLRVSGWHCDQSLTPSITVYHNKPDLFRYPWPTAHEIVRACQPRWGVDILVKNNILRKTNRTRLFVDT